MLRAVKIVDSINKVVGVILALMLAGMSVLVLAQITTRFVIDYPIHWAEEVSRFLMIYIVFMGAALALRKGRMVAIEIVLEVISAKKRLILKTIILILSMVFFAILFFQGLDMVQAVSVQKSAGARISMSIPYAAIPIGACLLFINAIAVMCEMYSKKEVAE